MSDDPIEVVLQLKEWHDNIINQLKIISEGKDDNFTIKTKEGEDDIIIKGEKAEGFRYGVILSLSFFDPFPVKIEKT